MEITLKSQLTFPSDLENADEASKPKKQPKVEPVEAKFNEMEDFSLMKRNIRLEFSVIQSAKFANEDPVGNTTDATSSVSVKKPGKSLWVIPRYSIGLTIWWFYTWPIRALTTCLIPNPKTYRRLYPLTFIMCILFIGANSYLVFWMMAVIGYTFGIPEVVMGLTILCWGSCLPEAIACIIIIRRGSGGVGVSNSLGSNSMAILFSLGVPWFLRTAVDGAWTKDTSPINIYSPGISYTILGIIFAILSLFLILSAYRYRLKKMGGVVLLFAYGVFLTLTLLLELNILFQFEDC